MTTWNPFQSPLLLIGYWSGSGAAEEWPSVAEFVDPSWDTDERLDVGVYLQSGLVARAWMGYARCRLCDLVKNGNLDLTDGTYVWPEGLAHYVLEHDVRLPNEFVDHVRAQNELTDGLRVDDTWWRRQIQVHNAT
ncbi:hypothetical protein [Terrabacter sp. BE26]|uniref:hypothetical protein n=1 Tax=Terrabacter sp. BE26 TaxID=2898152 RepID=UPI0035BE5212